MKNKKTAKIAHISFDVGLIIKAFDVLAEIFGGIVLISLSPAKLNMLIALIAKGYDYHTVISLL